MNIKVSVIIPVYNTEKYLRECLDSVINQTLKDVEIIVVNDGSTDNSLKILEKYADIDGRIKIINKVNEGLGAARKTGLDNANGEYIYFVDSDDWIVEDALLNLYENAMSNNSDVVILDVYEYDENNNKKLSKNGDDIYNVSKYIGEDIDFNNCSFTINEIKPFLLNRGFGAWYKFYKHSFLKKYDGFYFPKYTIFEDIFFHVQVLLRANRVSFCSYQLYVYRLSNETSILNSVNDSVKIFDIFDAIDNVYEFLIQNNKMDSYNISFKLFVVEQLGILAKKVSNRYSLQFYKKVENYFINFNLSKEELDGISLYHSKIYGNLIDIIQKEK